jgi:hypothetical protein
MEPQEVEMQGVNNPVNVDDIIKDDPKLKNSAKKKKEGVFIKWLTFKNVAIIYKDEIGRLERVRIELKVPAVEKSWQQVAARKRMWLWFDDQNILPTQVLQVALPSSGGVESEERAEFLEKPLGKFTKEDCVNAAIYFHMRTVTNANSGDVERMRESVWLHYNNISKLGEEPFVNGQRNWDFPPMTGNEILK